MIEEKRERLTGAPSFLYVYTIAIHENTAKSSAARELHGRVPLAGKKIFKSFYQENICQGGFHPKDEIPPIN